MRTKHTNHFEADFEPIEKLLKAIRNDPLINKKVVNILKMESYPRHIVLSNWLEQLRRKSAPVKLIQTLSLLFDDKIAHRIYESINISKKNGSDN